MLKIYFLLGYFLTINLFAQDGIVKSYYGKGKISSRVSFVDDILEGQSFWYYENGNLKTEKNYSNGKLNGVWRNYYETGLLKDEIHYSDGAPDGVSKFYYENGALKEVKEYDNGKLILISQLEYDANYIAPFSAYEAGMKKQNMQDGDILCDADICPQPIGGIEEIERNIVYPELARKFNLEGKALISAKINLQGKAKNIKVFKSLGLGLDEAAIDAVKKTRFIPGEKNGEAIETEITFTLNLKLDEKKEPTTIAISDNYVDPNLVESSSTQFISCEFEICPKPIGGINELLKTLKYPTQAKRNNISGDVEIEAKINDLGFVISAEVVKGIGYGCDEAAKSAIIKTQFEPAMQNGKEVESTIKIVIPFILETVEK
ncbi:MAG: TonB family protein [Ignavibacteriales bacterium]|nr:TonB family protein [Ignavibacteriales bacterium]